MSQKTLVSPSSEILVTLHTTNISLERYWMSLKEHRMSLKIQNVTRGTYNVIIDTYKSF